MSKYFLYVIQSETGKKYIGITNNIERRLAEHNGGKSFWTSRYKGWRVIYHESCVNLSVARKRELYLKSLKGGKTFKRIIGINDSQVT